MIGRAAERLSHHDDGSDPQVRTQELERLLHLGPLLAGLPRPSAAFGAEGLLRLFGNVVLELDTLSPMERLYAEASARDLGERTDADALRRALRAYAATLIT